VTTGPHQRRKSTASEQSLPISTGLSSDLYVALHKIGGSVVVEKREHAGTAIAITLPRFQQRRKAA